MLATILYFLVYLNYFIKTLKLILLPYSAELKENFLLTNGPYIMGMNTHADQL